MMQVRDSPLNHRGKIWHLHSKMGEQTESFCELLLKVSLPKLLESV